MEKVAKREESAKKGVLLESALLPLPFKNNEGLVLQNLLYYYNGARKGRRAEIASGDRNLVKTAERKSPKGAVT